MAVTNATITATTHAGAYTPTLDSTASFNLKPEYLGELYKRYGKGFGVFDVLELSGRKFNIASSTPKIIEEGAIERSITLAEETAVTGGSGAAATFEVATSGCYAGIGDIIVVPAYYGKSAASKINSEWQITAATANGANTHFTAYPLDDTTGDLDIAIPKDRPS